MKFVTYTAPDELEIIADWFDELAEWEDYEADMADQRLEMTTIAGIECWVTPTTARGLRCLADDEDSRGGWDPLDPMDELEPFLYNW